MKGEDLGTNSLCSVAGWGIMKTGGPKSDRLMEANVYLMNNTECSYRWGELYSLSNMMCTKGRGGGSCLVRKKKKRFTYFDYVMSINEFKLTRYI